MSGVCHFDPPGTGIITTGVCVCVILIRQGQVSLCLVCVILIRLGQISLLLVCVCVCHFDPPGTGIITTGVCVCVILIRQGQVSLLLVCVSF